MAVGVLTFRSPTDLGVRDMAVSVVLHLALAGVLFFSRSCAQEPEPLLPQDEIIMINLAALPRSEGRTPDRATRAPRPAEGAPEAVVAPPRPDAMSLPDPKAEKSKGTTAPPDPDVRRDELLRDLKREQLVRSLNPDAALGDVDRAATDPDGTLPPDMVFGTGTATGPVDPEAARWAAEIRRLVTANWVTLPRFTQDNPTLSTIVKILLDEEGKVKDVKVFTSSGNASFDDSAVRAVQRTARLPLPPAKFPFKPPMWIKFRFGASDAQ